MPSESTTTMTVRIPEQFKERLARLAEATDRSSSWLAMDAIRTYLELQEWQVAEIEAGVAEADRGEFATDEEVQAVVGKWRRDEGN